MADISAADMDLLDGLLAIDRSDHVTVNEWEAKFIESVLYRRQGDRPLSLGQRGKIRQIINHYGDQA